MQNKRLFIAAALLVSAAFTTFSLTACDSQGSAAAVQNREALLRPHAQTLGRAEASVQLVEFFDPACDTCAQFYPLVKKMAAEDRDEIRIVMRYAPFHPGSDQVVKALEAARRQGKFWPALEALLQSQPQWVIQHTAQPDLIWEPLARAGVDVERAKVDMQSPEIARLIQQDIADANAVGVSATPEFFVNGRPLPSFGFTQLQNLVAEELSLARARKARAAG